MLKVDHFAFEVLDMDRAIEFYQKTLGLELISRETHEEVHEDCAFLQLDGCTLELLCDTDRQNGRTINQHPNPLNSPHICFSTNDMDTILSMLKEKKIPLIKPMQHIPGHARWIYFPDPDGNVLEFIQWDEKK